MRNPAWVLDPTAIPPLKPSFAIGDGMPCYGSWRVTCACVLDTWLGMRARHRSRHGWLSARPRDVLQSCECLGLIAAANSAATEEMSSICSKPMQLRACSSRVAIRTASITTCHQCPNQPIWAGRRVLGAVVPDGHISQRLFVLDHVVCHAFPTGSRSRNSYCTADE